MVIATKVYLPLNSVPTSDPGRPNSHGLSRKHILEAVEGSLNRLQTDYIDLYQVSKKLHCLGSWKATITDFMIIFKKLNIG